MSQAKKIATDESGLNLDGLGYPWGYELAVEAFRSRDGERFAVAGYSRHVMLRTVIENWKALRERGMLPAALVQAIIGCKVNNRRWNPNDIAGYLVCCKEQCGMEGIRACGEDPGYAHPETGITLYRGVAGVGRSRKVKGVSWTDDLGVASWYARRLHMPDPAVFATEVCIGEVFCFTDKRCEREYLIDPRYIAVHKLTLSNEQMGGRAGAWMKVRQEKEKGEMAKLAAKLRRESQGKAAGS